jgi:hypothetical protein
MADLITQTRDYLEALRTPVTVEQIVTHPVAPIPDRRHIRRGPLVALASAVVVALVGLVAVLVQPNDSQIVRSQVVDEVIAGSQENSYYAVGFDGDGILCAEAGASFDLSTQSQGVCGDSDQAAASAYQQVAAAAYEAESFVALAGWVPTSAASVTAVYNGEIRRSLELTPVPGYDLYAFGAIEGTHSQFIEIEIADETGEIIQRYFPSIGPSD